MSIRKILKKILLFLGILSDREMKRMHRHWIRVICDEAIDDFITHLNSNSINVLEISGNRWENHFSNQNYNTLSFPEFDLSNKIDSYSVYDLIILEHVLEHLPNPSLAIKNIHKLLKTGGSLIIATPFLIKVHNAPDDCTRWTKNGLKHLLSNNGFLSKNIAVDQWGNKSAIISNFNKWVKYKPYIHSLKNEEQFPVTVWAFAKKN